MNKNNDNTISQAIDHIEPADGARERMLRNIKQKAAAQQIAAAPKKKVQPINRIVRWALPAAACLVIAVVGIRFIPNIVSLPQNNGVEIANPFEKADSAEEIANRLEITAEAPVGAENVSYTILDGKIAQVDFDYGGDSYTLRASKQSGDFSGIYGTVQKTEKIDAEYDAILETIHIIDHNVYKITWTDGATTYILVNNGETSVDQIIEIYNAIK